MKPATPSSSLRVLGVLGLFALCAASPACSPAATVRAPLPPAHATASAPPDRQAPPPSPESSAKVDDLMSRHVAARGGLEKLRALKSIRLTGTLRSSEDDFTIETVHGIVQKRPGSIRIEDTFQGLTGVDAYDGREMWSTEPWDGRRDAFRRSADESKELAHLADLDGPLVDWREKGHRVDYLGTEEIDGAQAHKLRVVMKDGDVEYHYLDPDTMLEMRIVYERHIRGVERIVESDVGDYEQVAGVWIPFTIASGRKGAPRTAHVAYERAEPNVEVDDAVFQFPAAGRRYKRRSLPPPVSLRPPAHLPRKRARESRGSTRA